MDTLRPASPVLDAFVHDYDWMSRLTRHDDWVSIAHHNAVGPERVVPPDMAPSDGADRPVVLVVDDDESIAEMLADLLGDEGYRVIVAYDGLSALDTARRERPAMILSDCMMPGMNGAQLLRELRGHPTTRSIAVALMSSVRPRGLSMPDAPFLAKPFEIDDVLELVARCTARSSLTLYGEG